MAMAVVVMAADNVVTKLELATTPAVREIEVDMSFTESTRV